MTKVLTAQQQVVVDQIMSTQTTPAKKTKLQKELDDAIDASDADDIDALLDDYMTRYTSVQAPASTAPASPSSMPRTRIGKYTSVRTGIETGKFRGDTLPRLKGLFANSMEPTPDYLLEGKNFPMADSCEVTDVILNYTVSQRKDSKQLTISIKTEKYGDLLINNLLTRTGEPAPIGKRVKLYVQHLKPQLYFYTSMRKIDGNEATTERIQINAELVPEKVLTPQERLDLAIEKSKETGLSLSDMANAMALFGV
jgi:hypothetical protein